MTTHAVMARQPFGEVSSSRLQMLASLKNRQNGIVTVANDAKAIVTSASPASKRTYDMAVFEDDSENIDPLELDSSSSKKTKAAAVGDGGGINLKSKPSTPPPSVTIFKPDVASSEPRSFLTRIGNTTPSKPMSAPAGRSPKRKLLGLDRTRRSGRPFANRIDPPFKVGPSAALPFSLDAALRDTLGQPVDKPAAAKVNHAKWQFKIHEDSPDEEAATLMEHSTLVLDLSSDDEAEQSRRLELGKENIAPEGYSAPAASRSRSTTDVPPSVEEVKTTVSIGANKQAGLRKKLAHDAMDDDQRCPLSELEVIAVECKDEAKISSACMDGESDATLTVPASLSFDIVSNGEVGSDRQHDVPSTSPKAPKDDIVVFDEGANATDVAATVNDITIKISSPPI